jgi:hypothetical protein
MKSGSKHKFSIIGSEKLDFNLSLESPVEFYNSGIDGF